MQLVIRNGRLHTEGHSPKDLVDLLVDAGRFVAVEHAGVDVADVGQEIDVHGAMLSPPYVEPHVHMDTCLTAGEPRVERERHAVGGDRLLVGAQGDAHP